MDQMLTLNLKEKSKEILPNNKLNSQKIVYEIENILKNDDGIFPFELKDEFINSNNPSDKAWIIISGTSNRGWGFDENIEVLYEDTCNGIMDIKKEFLKFLDNIRDYTSDASDEKITEMYYNAYLNSVSYLDMNSYIVVSDDDLSIGCFEINVGMLRK